MKLSVEKITKETFDSCMDFLIPAEFRCIGLVSRLVQNGKPVFPQEEGALFVRLVKRENLFSSEKIDGILFITSAGIVLHCIADDCDRDVWAKPLFQFLSQKRLHSIIGSKKDTEWLETLSSGIPYRVVDYSLMIFQESQKTLVSKFSVEADNLMLRRAHANEIESILPLQVGYEKEEVLAPGEEVNYKHCKANLARILTKEQVYLITHNGIPVAKAGTNAQGRFWDQIGGVYTSFEFRGRGFATALVSKLTQEILGKNKKAALFVKIGNVAAQKAYQKAGFVDSLPFRISYF
ncbi:MAG TPA: GNAT family N-acetyltransferase [Treponemataceae bacterium]|nr:GNAT family N-acetyltransferase [Treponemataceae bacterium]